MPSEINTASLAIKLDQTTIPPLDLKSNYVKESDKTQEILDGDHLVDHMKNVPDSHALLSPHNAELGGGDGKFVRCISPVFSQDGPNLSKSSSNPSLFTPNLLIPSGMQNYSHFFANQHVLSVDAFNKERLNDLFNLARTYRIFVLKDRPLSHVLKVCFATGSHGLQFIKV